MGRAFRADRVKPPTPGFGAEKDWSMALRRSSFGPAAIVLEAQARHDLGLYYVYCRAIDDCADEFKPDEALGHLKRWKLELNLLRQGRPSSDLGRRLLELCVRRSISVDLLEELWHGARSDAHKRVRFKTWPRVRHYCSQVAGSVGLACLPIFGLEQERGRAYALALGEAFQLINILRDVREDAALGRLYFSLDDLKSYGLTQRTFMGGSGGARAQRLLYVYAWRAKNALTRADDLAVSLPSRALRPSRMMRALYGALLDRMEKDGLKVFERRYSLSRWRKRLIVFRSFVTR